MLADHPFFCYGGCRPWPSSRASSDGLQLVLHQKRKVGRRQALTALSRADDQQALVKAHGTDSIDGRPRLPWIARLEA